MKDVLESASESKKRYVNCFDLDGTITKYEADKDYESFLRPEAIIGTWRDHLINYLLQVKDAKAFHDGIIQDTPDEFLARAIKLSIIEGKDYNAILTFNTSIDYTKIILAMIGLTEAEISKLFIRHRKPDDEIENKNKFIIEALEYFKDGEKTLRSLMEKDYDCVEICLMDDNEDNINAADEYGIRPFLVPETVDCKSKLEDDSFEYLREFMNYKSLSKEDLMKVKLPSMEDRVKTALKILSPELTLDNRRVLEAISSNVAAITKEGDKLPASSAIHAGSKRTDYAIVDGIEPMFKEYENYSKKKVKTNQVSIAVVS